jgi:hypothetical protein
MLFFEKKETPCSIPFNFEKFGASALILLLHFDPEDFL